MASSTPIGQDSETQIARAQQYYDELLANIIGQLGEQREIVEQAMYHAGISTNTRPLELVYFVHEFLVSLDLEKRKQFQRLQIILREGKDKTLNF